jgi:hypothetical protein
MLTPAFMPPPMPICMTVWPRCTTPVLSMHAITYLHKQQVSSHHSARQRF